MIAELRDAIAMLSATLNGGAPAARAAQEQPPGFGHFDGLDVVARTGHHGISAFSIMLANDRSTLSDLGKIRPAGLKFN